MEKQALDNEEYLEMFIAAKRIEGCSERTIEYYKSTIINMFKEIETPVRQITTDDLRIYLTEYQNKSVCSKILE